MTKFRNLLYLILGIPLLAIFIWFFALPESLIQTTIEDYISTNGRFNIDASINGLRKGVFFTVSADSLELKKGKTVVLRITDISSRINPLYLLKKQFAFSTKGKMGTGGIEGFFKLPVGTTRFRENGSLKIDQAEINEIPYLRFIGLGGSGLISARLNLKNNIIDVIFKISEANIHSIAMGMPLPLNSFNKIQGALHLQENTIKITSISLEGDKGYARLKGEVTEGFMKLILELMPSADGLKPIESMLISKYQVSPGYYVIPIEESFP